MVRSPVSIISEYLVYYVTNMSLVPRGGKLDDKGWLMILVGYHATGAYKMYDPSTQNMFISRDMVIYEGSSWDWKTMSSSRKP